MLNVYKYLQKYNNMENNRKQNIISNIRTNIKNEENINEINIINKQNGDKIWKMIK